jgi:hypothetical protein
MRVYAAGVSSRSGFLFQKPRPVDDHRQRLAHVSGRGTDEEALQPSDYLKIRMSLRSQPYERDDCQRVHVPGTSTSSSFR